MSDKTLKAFVRNATEHHLGAEFLREAERHTSETPTIDRVKRVDPKGEWSSLCFTFPGVRVHVFTNTVYPFMVERLNAHKPPFFTNDAATAAHVALRSHTHYG